MRDAHPRISSQSRRSRYSGGVFSTIARCAGPCGSVGTRPPKMTCSRTPSASAFSTIRGGSSHDGLSPGVADRPGTEHPERPLRQLLAVLAQEMLGIATPALHVHRAAEHHGVVGLNVADLAGIDAIDGQTPPAQRLGDRQRDLRRRAVLGRLRNQDPGHASTIASAGSASSVVPPRTGPANCRASRSSRQAHRRARLTVTAPTTIPATRQGLNQMDDPPASGHPLFGRLHPRRCGSIDIAAEIEEHHYARLECRHALSAPRAAVSTTGG